MDAVDLPPAEHPDQAAFDEAGYLRLYPDIGEAIAVGHELGAWEHYRRHGRAEGRLPNDLDAGF